MDRLKWSTLLWEDLEMLLISSCLQLWSLILISYNQPNYPVYQKSAVSTASHSEICFPCRLLYSLLLFPRKRSIVATSVLGATSLPAVPGWGSAGVCGARGCRWQPAQEDAGAAHVPPVRGLHAHRGAGCHQWEKPAEDEAPGHADSQAQGREEVKKASCACLRGFSFQSIKCCGTLWGYKTSVSGGRSWAATSQTMDLTCLPFCAQAHHSVAQSGIRSRQMAAPGTHVQDGWSVSVPSWSRFHMQTHQAMPTPAVKWLSTARRLTKMAWLTLLSPCAFEEQISHCCTDLQTTHCLQRPGCCLLVTLLPVNSC